MSSANSKGSGFCLAPFLVLVTGAAGYCLYKGLVAYLSGTPLTSPAVFAYLIFGAALLTFSAILLPALLKREPPAPPEEAPWTVRPAWQTNELKEKRSWPIHPFWALFWNLMSWPLAGYVLYDAVWTSPDPDWAAGLIVLSFPAVGVGFAWVVLKRALQWWSFRRSTLVMDTMPARLGRTLQARLRVPVAFAKVPDRGIHVRLSCYWQYRDKTGTSGSTVKKRLKWRDEATLSGQPVAGQPDATEVPMSFDVPAELPSSTPNEIKERMLWEIEAFADLPGLDYNAVFEIPVFESDSSPKGRASSDTVSSDTPTSPRRRPPRQRSSTDSQTDVTALDSDGVEVEGTPECGLTISFAPARRTKLASWATAVALPCLIGAVFFRESVSVALFFLLFGVAFGYVAWQKWTYACRLSVDGGLITLTRGALGNKSTTTAPCTALKDATVRTKGETFGTANYALALTLARSASDSSGDAENASTARSGSAQDVVLVNDLTYRPEAEWLAGQILKAADRQTSSDR